ncbi:hypothetical protein V492_02129 [Pseudogymnoascus sp. VKM F-4246]|nr:hypothetical protein V492_02129 [Pseudogymnoascus sp. VKM F-4246]
MVSPTRTPGRKPLHERSGSETNIAAIRLVPATPPQLLWSNTPSQEHDDIYMRTALPTHPAHLLPPPDAGASFFQESAALIQSEDRISAAQPLAKQLRGQAPALTTTYQPRQTPSSTNSTPSSSRPSSVKSQQRKRKQVKVNPDKTFSVLEVAGQVKSAKPDDNGSRSPSSSTLSRSTFDRLSSRTDSFAPRGASGATWKSETTATTATTATTLTNSCTPSPDLSSKSPTFESNIPSSPWNYKLVGGLRKVPGTPDLKQKVVPSSDSPSSLPDLPEIDQTNERELSNKQSFQSSVTTSTASDYNNYKVFPSSPPLLATASSPSPSINSDQQIALPSSPESYVEESTVLHHQLPPSSDQNYEILGQSSTGYSPTSSQLELYNTESNYEVHGDLSPSPSTSLINLPAQPQQAYSRESLVIPPLQPKAKRSAERFGYYKKHSRESLRTGSLTSITSALSEDFVRALATGRQLTRVPSLKNIPETSPWTNPLALNAVKTHMQAHPHQWSSQLSTVASVSEGGTNRNSRQWSDANPRRSSGFVSHTRQIPSIASTISQEDRQRDSSLLAYPQPTYSPTSQEAPGPMMRMAEEQDEYGDKLTDMPILHERPSRTRLSGFFGIPYDLGRNNSMRSISSSRANSLVGTTLPTWAQLYYGSGERRYLEAPGSSTEASDSRPPSSYRSGSPDTANFPVGLYSPRRRPRELRPQRQVSQRSHHSMDITPAEPPNPALAGGNLIEYSFKHRARKTSSVWSPHLAHDRRMSQRLSAWDAPSVDWSQGGFSSERNVQIIMFIVGFIMPISWMIAAVLPIPPRPEFPELSEEDARKSRLDLQQEMNLIWSPVDEKRYQNARWWRILNRIFSVVGVAIITLIVVLVVTKA